MDDRREIRCNKCGTVIAYEEKVYLDNSNNQHSVNPWVVKFIPLENISRDKHGEYSRVECLGGYGFICKDCNEKYYGGNR